MPDDVDARLGEIEALLDEFDTRPVIFDPCDITRAGVFVSIGAEGRLVVDRGYVRPDDEAPLVLPDDETDGATAATSAQAGEPGPSGTSRTVITVGGQPIESEDDEDDVIKPLPERLVIELTAHRTLALRDAVASNPQIALTVLLHKLVIDTFQRTSTGGGCLEASVRHVFFPAQAADLKDSPSACAIAERHDAWKADLPQDDQALWDWLSALDDASRLALLAHCVSFGVNALYEKPNPYGGNGVSQHGLERRLTQADRLARATGLDMVEAGWCPSVDNYLGRVPKRRIVEAVREGAGDRAAQLIEHLKKAEMAKEAERLLADARWLPEPLRLADTDTSSETAKPEAEASSVDLPAFLSGDEEASDEDTEPLPAIAAE